MVNMDNNRNLIALLLVIGMLSHCLGITNVTSQQALQQPPLGPADPLTNLGDITARLVSTLVEAEDEKVDIYGLANLVMALSKAATIVTHPEVYKDWSSRGEIAGNGSEEKVAKLSSAIRLLSDKHQRLEVRFDRSIRDQQAQQLLIDGLAHKLNQSEARHLAERQAQQLVMDDMAQDLNHSEALIDQLQQQVNRQRTVAGSSFVGFTAWSDVSDYYTRLETIKFPQVLFNYGTAFSNQTGMFTCPVPGVYSVNAHLEERHSGGLNVDVMLDVDTLFRLHVHDTSEVHGTSAFSAMVGCRSGQQIYLMSQDSGSDAQVQHMEKRTIFSVFLVERMSEEEVSAGNLIASGSD